MRFYLGTHHPNWLATDEDLFVSRRRLFERKTLPRAKGAWALDSGGFTELNLFGAWRTTEDEYVADVERFRDEIGGLDWVAPMDWMCEPFMLARTGLTLAEHQRRTVENFLRLRARLGDLVIPVLQGWDLIDYHDCVSMYEAAGIELESEPLVGIGSVCRRQDTSEAERIFRSLEGMQMHGFGIKVAGLGAFGDVLASSDSMAWSFEARRLRRRHDRQDSLFDWPKVMPCGLTHPYEHRAISCANCLGWARAWREKIVSNRLEEVAA